METSTIKKIKEIIPKIDEHLVSFRNYFKEQNTDMEAPLFGDESEYSVNSLIKGIRSILKDMRFLVKSHDLFINLSTLEERKQIGNELSNLDSYLYSNNRNVTKSLDLLKIKLRTYNLRLDRQRYLDFNVAIEELNRKALALEDEISCVRKKIVESETTYTDIEEKKGKLENILAELIEQKNSFVSEFNTFKSETSDFRDLATSAQANSKTISNNLAETNDAKDTFEEFVEKIDERESQLDNQKKKTDEYNAKLEDFAKSYEAKLNEVETLIEKSKQALQFTTAEGMSAAFASQYQNANNRSYKIGWLGGAVFFLLVTLGIGWWIVTGYGIESKEENMWFSLIGRLSMIPFTIYAAVFCSQQYVKQKNLVEDYAYKSVLSKSIIAFSEELRKNDPEKYTEYLSTVLREIHKDPLRKRGKEKDDESYRESTGILGKEITGSLANGIKSVVQTALDEVVSKIKV